MRLATSQLCRDLPCTSYSSQVCRRTASIKPRKTRGNASRKHRGTFLCAQNDENVQSQDRWNRLELITRKLVVAVSDEDYALAAQLRSEKETLIKELPAVSQYTFHQIQEIQSGLETGSFLQQTQAVKRLGGTGDKLALPYLLSCLKHKHLSAAASNAIYSIFLWHPDPEITALMNQACSLVHTRDAAVPLLDKVIEQEPDYYEAWNKRATAYYLASEFENSLKDCHKTLELQPDHFLAMSGMGLCYLGLERWDDALHWFEQSLKVHPHMEQIQSYITKLRAEGFGRNSSTS